MMVAGHHGPCLVPLASHGSWHRTVGAGARRCIVAVGQSPLVWARCVFVAIFAVFHAMRTARTALASDPRRL